ncbi:polysaccharide biosynthesis tyrosine autokinase [uncultured Bacteroides sp.]|uniref:GumC family protein n=1 Tax=uncultured Bacteroides sp. TaxID=162156 RepID=UPI002AAB8727|nr:polysaccharide biosynthesis tyrosine autokinase [uncultured Bacteroides sp.]
MAINKSDKTLLPLFSEEKSVNLVDLFMHLAIYWRWFLFSVLLFGSYFGYQYYATPFMYNRSMTVMVKTPENSQATMRMNRYNSYMSQVNVTSEILQFQSKELIRKTIDKLHADISYTSRSGLRQQELYTDAPIKVSFLKSMSDDHFSFSALFLSADRVELSGFSASEKEEKLLVHFNDTVSTPVGSLVISRSVHYSSEWLGRELKITKKSRESMMNFFLANLSIKQLEEDAAILHISLKDRSTTRAIDMLNALVSVYNEEAIEEKDRVAVKTGKFINKRLAVIEKELRSVESNIDSLKIANNGIDVSTFSDILISDTKESQSILKELDTQLYLVGYIKKCLQDAKGSEELMPNNTGLVSQDIESLISRYNSALLKRNQLREGSSSKNPIVRELTLSIKAMRKTIVSSVDNMLASLETKKKNLLKQEEGTRSKVEMLPLEQRLMLSMKRQLDVKENLYIFLLNKREENELHQAMNDDNAQIIDPASGSNAPMYPNIYKKMLLGVGCGLTIPTLILLSFMLLDTRVRTRKDLEALTLPFLGEIPLTIDKKTFDKGVFVKEQGRDSITEAFRILRTNLGFMAVKADTQKVITFTSFGVGAGKTFTSINLAVSLTQIHKKVLLLDLDLRKGALSSLVCGRQKRIGITHYLSEKTLTIEDILIQNALCDKVDLIPVGAIAPNPAELLLSTRLDELICELKKRYDYIIVDNVPIGIVADAAILDRITDLTLFVIRAGKLDRRLLVELENLYREQKFSNMALLLNGTKKDRSGYGYGYGYGYTLDTGSPKWKRKVAKFFRRIF